jgi:hypothetical protein
MIYDQISIKKCAPAARPLTNNTVYVVQNTVIKTLSLFFNTNLSRINTNLLTKIVKKKIVYSENSLKKSSYYTNFLSFTTIKFSGHFFLIKLKTRISTNFLFF